MHSFSTFIVNEMDRNYKKLMSRSKKFTKGTSEDLTTVKKSRNKNDAVSDVLKFSTAKRAFKSVSFKTGILKGITIPTTIPQRLDERLTEKEYLSIRRFDDRMGLLIMNILAKNERVASKYNALEYAKGYAIAQRRMKEEILKLSQRTYESDRELAAIDAAFDLIGAWGRPMNYEAFSNSDEDRHV